MFFQDDYKGRFCPSTVITFMLDATALIIYHSGGPHHTSPTLQQNTTTSEPPQSLLAQLNSCQHSYIRAVAPIFHFMLNRPPLILLHCDGCASILLVLLSLDCCTNISLCHSYPSFSVHLCQNGCTSILVALLCLDCHPCISFRTS